MRELQSRNESQKVEIDDLKADNAAQVTALAGLRDSNQQQNNQIEALQSAKRSQDSLIAELRHVQQYVEMLNQNLRVHNTALKAANQELESFCYAVSHDLRGPLRGIHGFSMALERSAKDRLTADERGYLQRVCNGVERMGQLIDDLLQLSRLTRAEMKFSSVDLTALAREIAGQLQEREPARRACWQIEEGLCADGDPVLLRVALDNLLGNAWKYTSRAPEAIISFGRIVRNGQPAYCVRDNGVGFDMTYAHKLFTPFQRLHSIREFPGSGVGLASVARVIHRHGGTVAADSKLNEGAAFYFTIPATDTRQTNPPLNSSRQV